MMLALLLLAIALVVAEGDPLLHSSPPPLLLQQLVHRYKDDLFNHDLLSDIHTPYPRPEIFHDLFSGKGEPLMGTHSVAPFGDGGKHGVRIHAAEYWSGPAVSLQVSLPSDSTEDHERQSGREERVTNAPSSGEDHLVSSRRRNPGGDIPHRRQKRFILGNKLRTIAVPLSVFNFLGFLPVRVPGLPYHNDLPSPDYSHYDTTYEIYVPRRRRRYRFYD